MTYDELMSLLADRPGCCAVIRKAATEEIEALKRRIEELEAMIHEKDDLK